MEKENYEFLEYVLRTTIPVRIIDKNNSKINLDIGSGFFLEYRGKKFFITVEHISKTDGVYAIVTGNTINKNDAELIRFEKLNIPKKVFLNNEESVEKLFEILHDKELSKNLKSEDIASIQLTNIPNCIQRELKFNNDSALESCSKIVIKSTLDYILSKNDVFGFSGRILMYGTDDKFTDQIIVNMEHEFSHNGWEIFKLDKPIERKEDFQGCSGAPILNKKKDLVGVVLRGNEGEQELLALSVKKLKLILDHTYFNQE